MPERVKFICMRTPDMKNTTFVLTLQLVDNGTFLPGAIDFVKISITDQIVKPDWWDYTYNRYMGSYSPTKLRLWLEYHGCKRRQQSTRYAMSTSCGLTMAQAILSIRTIRTVLSKLQSLSFKVWLRDKERQPL
jgi:hypothetical protein